MNGGVSWSATVKYLGIVGVLTLGFGVYGCIRALQINQQWEETTATVERVESRLAGRETRYFYHITYDTADGQTLQTVLGRNEQAPFGLTSMFGNNGESPDLGLSAGQTLPVRYAASNPSYAIDAHLIWRVPTLSVLAGTALILPMLVTVVLARRS